MHKCLKTGFVFLFFCGVFFAADVKIGKNRELIVDGKPFFPLTTWLQPSKNIDKNKELGINVFLGHEAAGESPKAYLDACAAKKVYAGISFWDLSEAEIKSIKDHPALLEWVMPDEPDQFSEKTNGPIKTPEELMKKYKWLKAIDSTHPTDGGFTQYWVKNSPQVKPAFFPEFEKVMDLIGFDIYPCNNGEPKTLYWQARGLKKLSKLTNNLKPHNVFLECNAFDKKNKGQRAPTPSEFRAQVWMSIVHGAHSIGYFTHSWIPSYSQFFVPEDIKTEMKKVNRQITELAPVILGPASTIAAEVTNSPGLDVAALIKEDPKKIYIFTSNIKNVKGEAEIKLAGLGDSEVQVYEEGTRKLAMKGGKFIDTFNEFEPHIYVLNKK